MSEYIRWDKVDKISERSEKIKKSINKRVEKWANKIVVGGSVKPHFSGREEGEIWTDHDGKEWTKKDGIIQSVPKLQSAKTPWFCPKCEGLMNHWLHEKFWRLRGKCHNCVIKEEHEMRMNGTWEFYERKIMRENERAFLKNKIEEHKTYIKEFKEPCVYFENGGFEIIAKREEFEPLFEDLRKDISFCEDRLKVLDQEELDEELKLKQLESNNEKVD